MIQPVDVYSPPGGIDRGHAPLPPVAPPIRPPAPASHRPLAPGDQRRGLSPPPSGRRAPESLGEQLIEAIKPKSPSKRSAKPIGVRLSLSRVAHAIEILDVTSTDPLLKTAYRLLAEEQLRVEMMRHRLQMILEG